MTELDKGLTKKGSGNFFRVIGLPDEKPLFSNEILDFWNPAGGLPGYENGYDVGLCRIKKPFTYFNRMERHKSSCEILIPINDDMFVPLAPPGEMPEPDRVKIVPVKMGELIVLDAGTWHFAAGPLGRKGLDYFVLLRRGTPEHDLEMRDLEVSIRLRL